MNLILLVIAIFVMYKLYENIMKFGCKCENCGKNIKCDDEFCIYCGARQKAIDVNLNTQLVTNQSKHYNYYEVLDDLDGVIVALMAKIAKSDGVISKEEAEYISDVYKELANLTNKSLDVIDIYEEIFEREKKDNNIMEFVTKLKDLEEEPREYVLNILQNLANIDGDLEVLEKIKTELKS
jgi:uncharacterized tellurite resistance protein B-like protein